MSRNKISENRISTARYWRNDTYYTSVICRLCVFFVSNDYVLLLTTLIANRNHYFYVDVYQDRIHRHIQIINSNWDKELRLRNFMLGTPCIFLQLIHRPTNVLKYVQFYDNY